MEIQANSVASIIRLFREELKNSYKDREIGQFLNILFREWKGWDRATVRLNFEKLLSPEETARFYNAIDDLKKDKPIQYITGNAYFLDLELMVNPQVLIPRPETEELVSLVIKENHALKNEKFSVLDIGTGSGCIALSMKKFFVNADVSAIDDSVGALKIAAGNAERNGCPVSLHLLDILKPSDLESLPFFNIIISNPPYITESEKKQMRKNVLDYEPPDALFVPDDDPLVYYRAIADFAPAHLHDRGLLYLEINENFGDGMIELLQSRNFTGSTVIKDIYDKDRFIRAGFNER